MTRAISTSERALSSLNSGRAVKELIGGRPAQDQRGCLCDVDTRRHMAQPVVSERAIAGIRPDNRHIGHAVAKLEADYAVAQLINFADDVIAQHERRFQAHRLRV